MTALQPGIVASLVTPFTAADEVDGERLRAIVRFGFEQLGLNRIYARIIADNHESVRLLERLGFQREGTFRKHSWEDDGTFHDSAMYGLLREEFPS